MSKFQKVYKFDEKDGSYLGPDFAQIINDVANLAPDTIAQKPALKEGCYYKVNDKKNGWDEFKYPTNAQECLGISVSHQINNSYTIKMRKILEQFADNVSYRIYTEPETLAKSLEKIPDKTLEEVRQEKLNEIARKANSFENNLNKDMFFISSLGFKADGDRRTNQNLQSLINTFDQVAQGTPETVFYWDYDNITRQLTKEELVLLLKEQTINSNNLYVQKKRLQDQVKYAKTKDELEQIEIGFVMLNFSAIGDEEE